MEETLQKYDSLEDLLYAVFRTAATAGREKSELLAAIMGIARGGGDLSSLEVAAEAVNIRHLALREAGYMGQHPMCAKYAYPVDRSTRRHEQYAIKRCAQYCMAANDRLRDGYFVQDAVRDFCSKKMHHDYKWWAEHLERSQRTVEFRWAKGQPADKSIHQTMIKLLAPAEARVATALYARGIQWSYLT